MTLIGFESQGRSFYLRWNITKSMDGIDHMLAWLAIRDSGPIPNSCKKWRIFFHWAVGFSFLRGSGRPFKGKCEPKIFVLSSLILIHTGVLDPVMMVRKTENLFLSFASHFSSWCIVIVCFRFQSTMIKQTYVFVGSFHICLRMILQNEKCLRLLFFKTHVNWWRYNYHNDRYANRYAKVECSRLFRKKWWFFLLYHGSPYILSFREDSAAFWGEQHVGLASPKNCGTSQMNTPLLDTWKLIQTVHFTGGQLSLWWLVCLHICV